MKLCFATNNKHKLQEVREAVGSQLTISSLNDLNCFEELPETSDTLEGNSFQKADYVFSRYKIPCIADDSGLEVSALDNAPGVYSARYAGLQKNDDDNISLLLQNMQHVNDRSARFRTIITLVGLGGVQQFEGIVTGKILNEKRGNMGFGYDPIFVPNGFNKTFAEMTMQEKNTLSHRAIALQKLIAFFERKEII